jgi:hypothetical protein
MGPFCFLVKFAIMGLNQLIMKYLSSFENFRQWTFYFKKCFGTVSLCHTKWYDGELLLQKSIIVHFRVNGIQSLGYTSTKLFSCVYIV